MVEGEQKPTQNLAYNSPMNQYGGSILILTNPEEVIFKLELALRNQRIDRNGDIVDAGRPLLNETGINSVISHVQSVVNQVTVMSNLNKQDIPAVMEIFADGIIKDLIQNGHDYDVRDIATLDKVFSIALNMTYICVKRSYEGDDKKFWKGSLHEITQRIEGQERRGLFGWGGKK